MKTPEKPLSSLPLRPEAHVKRVIESTNLDGKKTSFEAPPAPPHGDLQPALPKVAQELAPEKPKRISEPAKGAKAIRLSVDLDKDFHKLVRRKALEQDLALTDLVRNMLENYIKE